MNEKMEKKEIKNFRKGLSLYQKELAKLLGVLRAYVMML